MNVKSRYYFRSRIGEAKFRQLIRCFALDFTAVRTAQLTGISVRSLMRSFTMVYNFARRHKTLKGLTPYEYICKIWINEPERFNVNTFQYIVGLNS